ncbi:MAG: GNAT family protein [Micrococcales bacterium]|nr:GNAT family protein [Micrococcales bacterium]
MSCLRPYRPEDHDLLQARESIFDDFGPHAVNPDRSSRLDEDGGLVVGFDVEGPARGEVSWHWVQWGPTVASRCPMIGIYLWPEARGRGLGVRAQRELTDLFFRHTATNRVEAHNDIENLVEQRALERIGFQREGLVRGAHWRGGAYRDGYLYAVLRADWTLAQPPAPSEDE